MEGGGGEGNKDEMKGSSQKERERLLNVGKEMV